MRFAVLIISTFVTFETCMMAAPRIGLPKRGSLTMEQPRKFEAAPKNIDFPRYTFGGYVYPHSNDNDDRGGNFNSVIQSGRNFGNLLNGDVVQKLRKLDHKTSRCKRFALLPDSQRNWVGLRRSTNMTYNVVLDSNSQPSWYEKDAVLKEIQSAFAYWARESPLEFTYQPDGRARITIQFTKGQTNVINPDESFGAPHGLLGLTDLTGRIFLDITEDWTINTSQGYSIFQVAAHHIGHVLGVAHSNDDASVMLKLYPGNRKYFRTAPDDIRAIQALYGKGKGSDVIDDESPVYEEYDSLEDTYPLPIDIK